MKTMLGRRHVSRKSGRAAEEDGMTSRNPRRFGLAIALNVVTIAPPLIVVAFLAPIAAAVGDRTLFHLLGAAIAWSALWAIGLGILRHRGLDEVQRAREEFAVHWGAIVGFSATVILLFVPPFQSFVDHLVTIAGGAADAAGRKAAWTAFALGVTTLGLAQLLGKMVASIGWWIAKR